MELIELISTINKTSLIGFTVLTMGLVQVFKAVSQDALDMANDYLPIVSIVVGVLISMMWSTLTGVGVVEHIFIGLGFGLAGSGLFDQHEWIQNILDVFMPNR